MSFLTWYELGMLAVAMVVHELGHYLGFRLYRIKASFNIRWWGIEIGHAQVNDTTPLQVYVITTLGIMAGLLCLFNTSTTAKLIYFIMCSMDITNLINIFGIPKQFLKQPMREYYKHLLKLLIK